jgi:signal transduction histidine kinase
MLSGQELDDKLRRWHFRLAAGYAAIGVAYIFTSGRLVEILVPEPGQIANFEIIKGTGYVLVTASLLYWVLSVIRKQVVDIYAARNRVWKERQQLMRDLERRVQERTGDLEFVIQELESFSYSVSHDLRRPLRAMDARRSELSQRPLDDDSRRLVEELGEQIRQMSEMIEDLLALSRVGKDHLKRDEVDVTALCRRTLAELQRREPERIVNCDVELGLRLHGDESMVNLALMNILHNAWKFTTATDSAEIRVRGEDGAILIEDNGIGFDVDQANEMFKPFARLASAEHFPGTGIGLAIVERIMRRHGGTVQAELRREGGARFVLRFPPPAGTEDASGSV